MTHELSIGQTVSGKPFTIPREAVTQTFGILAKRGVGKTYAGAVMVEEMLKHEQQVVVVDPVGVWWGLRSSADGKEPGFAIVVFGGEHGDLPLEEHAGEIVAQAIIENGFSAVIDLSLFRKGAQVRFMTAFAEALYRLNRKPLHLMVDEADEFAPQRPMHGSERLLGSFEDIVRRGRARGLGVTLITQRAAVLNKNVLTQIEVLIILRNISPQDREAIEAWTEIHGTKEQLKHLSESMASLAIGNAWFWSPGWLDIFQKITVRKRITFDSSATPKIGEVAKRPKALAEINLDQLGAQIKATAESAKANNPAEIKKQLAAANQELAKLRAVAASPPAKPAKAPAPVKLPPMISEARLKQFGEQIERLELTADRALLVVEHAKQLQAQVIECHGAIKNFGAGPARTNGPGPAPVAHPVRMLPRAQRPAPAAAAASNGELDNAQQKILDTVKMLRARGLVPNREMIARWHSTSNREGIHPNGGSYGQNLAKLRAEGYLAGCELTDKGAAAARDLQTGFDAARGTVTPSQDKILHQLASYQEHSRESLAEALGIHPNGGSYGQNLARLRVMGLITERGPIKITEAAAL
jgi:uncharacterized protein